MPNRSADASGNQLHELKREIESFSAELGFARMGCARAELLHDEEKWLTHWLAEGFHGEMQWMKDTAEVRVDPRDRRMLEKAQTVIVLAAPYRHPSQERWPHPYKVARYAQGRDYHNVLKKRAEKMAKRLRERGYLARAAVDTAPVLERAWAQRAGVGFVGKNCCLIVPGVGSHVFLASVVTSAPLEPDAPMAPRCGDCDLCLRSCPTDAFVAANRLNATRCISYLTIEHRGEIDESLKPKIGRWLFGCDQCQDVCPYNKTSVKHIDQAEPFAMDERWAHADLNYFANMDEEEFSRWSNGSAVKRAKQEGLVRNAEIVSANIDAESGTE